MKKPISNKLLAIDLGNTTVSYALFQNRKVVAYAYSKNDNIPALINFLKKKGVRNALNVIMSSVVPKKAIFIKKALKRNFKEIKIWEVGRNVHPGVKMRYKRRSLGADRLVNVYGAIQKYRLPALVIDFGTAITFDYVDRNGIFAGGLITPGIETSWKSLQERAALLPKYVNLKAVNQLTATDTNSAMSSGLLNGFGALTDGLIDRFKEKFGRKLTVLATGGSSPLIARYSRGIDKADPLHTLRSLDLLFLNEIS